MEFNMKTDISFIARYFKAEQLESLVFVAIGLITFSIALAAWFKFKTPFLSGLAWPFLLVALIQLTVGISVYLRSPKDIIRVEAIAFNLQEISQQEIPRMETVMKNFVIYRYVEISLLLIGIGLLVFLSSAYSRGIGLGLLIQAALMLGADYFAEKRGSEYQEALISHMEKIKN
jgi:uncharacterized membrane protein YczE